MMRQYEAVYVFDSTLEDAAITDKLGRLHGLLGNPSDLQLTTGDDASSRTPSGAANPATTSSPALAPTPRRFRSTNEPSSSMTGSFAT